VDEYLYHQPPATTQELAPELDAIEHQHAMSASPALLEYDRLAALADRASRNSINDLVEVNPISTNYNASQTLSRSYSDTVEPIEAPQNCRETQISQAREQDQQKDRLKSKPKEAWVAHSSEQSDKGKFKRQNTMDKLGQKKGYEGSVEKRIKQAEVPIKPIAATGKRQTEKMVSSIMTRQSRDKEKSAAWKY
jgi:hypothetical protein